MTAKLSTKNFRQLTQQCPHCSERAVVQDSRQVTRTVRELYFACTNLFCGATFKSQLAVLAMISPSACPHPDVILPILPPRIPRRRVAGIPAPANDDIAAPVEVRA